MCGIMRGEEISGLRIDVKPKVCQIKKDGFGMIFFWSKA